MKGVARRVLVVLMAVAVIAAPTLLLACVALCAEATVTSDVLASSGAPTSAHDAGHCGDTEGTSTAPGDSAPVIHVGTACCAAPSTFVDAVAVSSRSALAVRLAAPPAVTVAFDAPDAARHATVPSPLDHSGPPPPRPVRSPLVLRI